MSNGNTIERLWKLQTKVNMLVSDGRRDAKAVADILQSILNGDAGCRWRKENGIIYFSVTSDGTTGKEWIERLEGNGSRTKRYCVEDIVKYMLSSQDFTPTSGVTTEIAVLRGGNYRGTQAIRSVAAKRKFLKPNAEVACLICDMFTSKELKAIGLNLIGVMHEPIRDRNTRPQVLAVYHDEGCRGLTTRNDNDFGEWPSDCGFAFVVPPA